MTFETSTIISLENCLYLEEQQMTTVADTINKFLELSDFNE